MKFYECETVTWTKAADDGKIMMAVYPHPDLSPEFRTYYVGIAIRPIDEIFIVDKYFETEREAIDAAEEMINLYNLSCS